MSGPTTNYTDWRILEPPSTVHNPTGISLIAGNLSFQLPSGFPVSELIYLGGAQKYFTAAGGELQPFTRPIPFP